MTNSRLLVMLRIRAIVQSANATAHAMNVCVRVCGRSVRIKLRGFVAFESSNDGGEGEDRAECDACSGLSASTRLGIAIQQGEAEGIVNNHHDRYQAVAMTKAKRIHSARSRSTATAAG